MDANNNEEILEELEETEEKQKPSFDDESKEEQSIPTDAISSEPNEETQVVSDEVLSKVEEYTKSKSKVPIIVVLSILLVLDIAALVIYLIGIDKVLSFIK